MVMVKETIILQFAIVWLQATLQDSTYLPLFPTPAWTFNLGQINENNDKTILGYLFSNSFWNLRNHY